MAGAWFAVAGAAFASAGVLASLPAAIAAAVIALVVMWVRSKALSHLDAARLIESRYDALDNLVITAAELDARPRDVRAEIGDEIARLAAERVGHVDPNRVVPLASPIAVAAAVLIGCGLLSQIGRDSIQEGLAPASTTAAERSAARRLGWSGCRRCRAEARRLRLRP